MIAIGSAKNPSDHHAVSRKARKRLDKLIPMDVVTYADNWGSEISKTLREYSLTGDEIALEEGYRAALSLVAAYESLKSRLV